MFGNPRWFGKKTIGLRCVPVTWKGWAYSAGWAALVMLPFMVLASSGRAMEALIWLAVMIVAWTWDMRAIGRRVGHACER